MALMGAMCWPTFALFVACCPKPETIAPDEVFCPMETSRREECCNAGMVKMVLEQFGTLSQEDIARNMPEDDYEFVLLHVREQLFRLLRDISVLSVDAWRLLALSSVRHALFVGDVVKETSVHARSTDELHDVWREGMRASRLLARAMFRVENFQQFLLGHMAHASGQLLEGFDPEKVREAFAPALDVYVEATRAHDLLAYNLLPQVERLFLAEKRVQDTPRINLLVVSLGAWAKTGFTTLWTVLKRTSARLRVFVVGDPSGLEHWRLAVEELREVGGQSLELLDRADFEYIDFAAHPNFKALLQRYPAGCSFGDAGAAILARVVCHEVLPADVDRVITIDLGDILVLDDIRQLWDIGDHMEEHHFLAAPHAVSLHHVNGGLVIYNVRRMRERNFSGVALRAAEDGIRAAAVDESWDRACLRDQSIINIIHSFREEFGYAGPSPVMILPCRWSLFPATEWQPHWLQPRSWLPEIVQRRRYPGIVSATRVEVYCPDEPDMLSAWAYVPMTELSSDGETRQSRLRIWAHHEGRKTTRYCSPDRAVGGKCCICGESAALVHVAGDMKTWPGMQNFLLAHAPPWREPPELRVLLGASSRDWWGGDARSQRMAEGAFQQAYLIAKLRGFNAQFGRCVTIRSAPARHEMVNYHLLELRPQLPLDLHVETTAVTDAYLLVGVGGRSGLELAFGANDGETLSLRVVRSSPGWAARGGLMSIPIPEIMARHRLQTEGGFSAGAWCGFAVKISADAEMEIEFKGPTPVSVKSYIPEEVFHMLRNVPLTVSVATHSSEEGWGVCVGPPP